MRALMRNYPSDILRTANPTTRSVDILLAYSLGAYSVLRPSDSAI